jgi:hypothetical protein
MPGAARGFIRDWKTLAGIEIFVVLISLVLITPTSEALLRLLLSRSGDAALTDADIALFSSPRTRGSWHCCCWSRQVLASRFSDKRV